MKEVANTWAWVTTRDRTLGIRLTGLSHAEAYSLIEEYGGSVCPDYAVSPRWQWEVSGKKAAGWLAAHRDEYRLAIVERGTP